MQLTRTFYQYLGLHSLLIGLFPFFIPVFLWDHGFELGAVSLFIGAGGVGFCVGLWMWDRLRHVISLTTLIGLSLVLEILLLLNVRVLGIQLFVLLLPGFSYGVYNSFFWTTQRAMFFERVDATNSGRRYGNLQIFVGLLLQIGILVGGFLLEKTNFNYVLVASIALCMIGFDIFVFDNTPMPASLREANAVSIPDILRFRDQNHSVLIFIVDGIYLFLESFFWGISLFLIAHESFTRLGMMVMSLAVIFGILFYLLKNTIDRLARKRVYRFAVLLYAASWVMRAFVDNELSLLLLFISLVLITFCTSFFRLAMNKRFYDLARDTLAQRYLILKSYYSQITIAIVYLGFGWAIIGHAESQDWLVPIYWMAAVGSFVFLLYGSARYDGARHDDAR